MGLRRGGRGRLGHPLGRPSDGCGRRHLWRCLGRRRFHRCGRRCGGRFFPEVALGEGAPRLRRSNCRAFLDAGDLLGREPLPPQVGTVHRKLRGRWFSRGGGRRRRCGRLRRGRSRGRGCLRSNRRRWRGRTGLGRHLTGACPRHDVRRHGPVGARDDGPRAASVTRPAARSAALPPRFTAARTNSGPLPVPSSIRAPASRMALSRL